MKLKIATTLCILPLSTDAFSHHQSQLNKVIQHPAFIQYSSLQNHNKKLLMVKSDTTTTMMMNETDASLSSSTKSSSIIIPPQIQNIVLQQVYIPMMMNIEQYGHPNIPLGSTDGKKCKVLRRLVAQKKLSEDEMNILQDIGFRFNNLEEIYEEADFEDIFKRLVEYKAKNSNFQIPKKYKEDPELGAWVAVIRRFGPDGVDQERRQSLDEIGFEWKSTRKCQSSFMNNFRLIRDTLKEQDEEIISSSSSSLEQFQSVLDGKDPNLWKWIKAQRAAYELDNLIEARVNYLNQLPFDWKEVS